MVKLVVNDCQPTFSIVDDRITHEDWAIYPNPVFDFLILEIPTDTDAEDIEVGVYTPSGKVINNIKPTLQAEKQLIINISHLNRGLYFVGLKQKDQTVTFFKVLKN